MKIVIQTQFRENYGAHTWDGKGECPQYWKSKGGETYVLRDLAVKDALKSAAIVEKIRSLIEHRSEGSEEYIIDWRLADDCESDGCEAWETPWVISPQDEGDYIAFREVRNDDEYGYMRQDILKKVEKYRMVQSGNREDYNVQYFLRDGGIMDFNGNRIDVMA